MFDENEENPESLQSLLYQENMKQWQPIKQKENSSDIGERVWLGQSFDLAPEFDAASEVAMSIDEEMSSIVVSSTITGNNVEEKELELQKPEKGLTPLGWGVIGLIGYMLIKGK